MNTLSILEEMWAESMQSIQLSMSGYILYFAVCVSGVENEGQWNGSFRRWTEKKNKIKLYTYLTSVITSTSDEGTFTVRPLKDVKWQNDTTTFSLDHLRDVKKYERVTQI